jgi:hypothetical protein
MILMRAGMPLVLWAASASAAAVPLSIVGPVPEMAVDKSGNASLSLTLQNATGRPAPLRLFLGDFVHSSTKPGPDYPLNTTSTIAGNGDADRGKLAKQQLLPRETLGIKIAVSQLWETGESTAELKNLGQTVATLRALRIPAEYNVQLEGPNPEAVFSGDSHAFVKIINNDPATHHFKWELVSQGNSRTDQDHSNIEVPANGAVQLDLSKAGPPVSLLQAGTLKEAVVDSNLILHPVIPAQIGIPPLAAKMLPLKLRLRFWSPLWQELWASVWTMFFLLVGGLASLWFRYYIPNATGAIKLRRDLHAMIEKLNGIGDSLDSQWRVLLSWRISSCRDGLHDMFWFFPAFASRFTELQNDAKMFSDWVDIAYGVSLVLEDTNKLIQRGIPPTMRRLIQEQCDLALRPIVTGFTKPEELEAMHADLKAAQDYVQALSAGLAIADLDKIIKDRENALQPEINVLIQAFPSFAGLLTQLAARIAQPITPAAYLDRDTFSLKAELLKQYRDLTIRAGAAVFPPAMAAAVGVGGGGGAQQHPDTALGRIVARDSVFKDYVEPDAYESLRVAQFFVTEMRQDFYTDALEREIQKNPPALQIRTEPASIQQGVPVHFSLRFLRQGVNGIAALQEWTCYWDFGDGTEPETGWDVYHCYNSIPAGPSANCAVAVKLVDLEGQVMQPSAPITKTVTVQGQPKRKVFRIRRLTPQAKIEASRLGFVLLIALLGVFVTARGKVETLGVFEAAGALIALGFGVDTLKNLITQTPAEK